MRLPLADRGAVTDHDMHNRSQPAVLLIYFGVLATCMSIIALGLTAVVDISAAMSEASARDKTVLELQVETSREIRRALATPVSQPPQLAPITARPARNLGEATMQTRKRAQPKPSQEALNAMAMGQSETYPSVQSSSFDYAVRDRHTSY